MSKRIISMIIILLATFALCIIYREKAPMYFLTIEILLVACTLAFAFVNRMTFSFRNWSVPGRIRLGTDKTEGKIRCSFKGGIFLFPVKNYIVFRVKGNYDDKAKKIRVPFYSGIRDNNISFPVELKEIGITEILPVKMMVFDATGIMGIPKKINTTKKEITVFPEAVKVKVSDETVKTMSGLSDGDDDAFYPDHPGDDPSEIFGFRDYKEGDKPSHINWKLSAREKKLIVKELSDPVKENVCVVWNNTLKDRDHYNSVMTVLYSVSNSLRTEEIAFSIFNSCQKELCHILDNEALDKAILEAFRAEGLSLSALKGELSDEGRLRSYSTIIYITDQKDELDLEDERVKVIGIDNNRFADNISVDNTARDLRSLWLELK